MKHKWDRLPDTEWPGIARQVKQWTCKVCGCKKSLANIRFSEAQYQRSGINYDRYVECYDDADERLKTID